ncbi:cilia- and flagella-associated protein 91 isoform 2-T2 [Spinachia spinachia]
MSSSVTHTTPTTRDSPDAASQRRVYRHACDPVDPRCCEAGHVTSGPTRNLIHLGGMFSEVSHHPQYSVQLDTRAPGPASMHKERPAGVIPSAQSWLKREECHVTGADRWKYFKRPLIPFAQKIPPDAIFALPKEHFVSPGGENAAHSEQPTHFTVGVQTDYRESETQTDPYSPEYAVQPGTTPSELLQLAALTWGRGLPAGLAEVEMIERARAKRAWEATLPPLDDLSQLDKRRRMMEVMEVKEWAFREGEIHKLQEARLTVLKDLLRQRDEAQKDVTKDRLNHIYAKHKKDKETKLNKIHNDYVRSLRKLEAKRRNVEGEIEQLGRVKTYTNIQTRAPQNRRYPFSNTCNNETKSHYLDTCEGLQEIEAGLSASCFKSLGKVQQPIKTVISPPGSTEVELVEKYKALIAEEKEAKKSSRYVVKLKPVARPVTPTVEEPPEGDEEKELAVISLQKLLRGRSVQYKMFKGKENNLELIRELRTVHALQGEEQELLNADKGLVTNLKIQMEKHRHKTSQEEASQARTVGAELEPLFDTLSKELIHLQEERRIHAFTLLAERDRRLREAEESGRRQTEERRRREEDEIFRQVVQVHQETVDLYLEDVILGSVEQTADKQAREDIHRRAKEVNDIAYAVEESRNSLQSEEIVSELMYSFLIPEVEKMAVRQRVHQRQLRHLQAARSILQGAAECSGILPTTAETALLTAPTERSSNRGDEQPSGAGEGEEN